MLYDFVILLAVLAGIGPDAITLPWAVRHELMDAREISLPVDIRWRIWESPRLPALCEAENLPPMIYCTHARQFNRAHAGWLDSRFLMDFSYGPWIKENDLLHAFWDSAEDARNPYRLTYQKRESMARCRDVIGVLAWNLREWPEYVPLWRFVDGRNEEIGR